MLSWHDRYLKKMNNKSFNSQNRSYGEKSNHIYEIYNNTELPHGCHIYAKASDMEKATMCAYPHSDHALPHRKRVLQCCANCECINLPDQ